MRFYAIGDIHGHLDQLIEAHRLIDEDRGRVRDPDAAVVHTGDLVDRGPDSKGVIDHLIAGRARGAPWAVLLGNHDRMFLRFVRDGASHDPAIKSGKSWLHPALGGATTLASYGVAAEDGDFAPAREAAARAVPAAHLDFVASLPLWIETEMHICVHAGIRPGIALQQQTEEDLLWIRDDFLRETADHGKLVVHGHTALKMPTFYGNRLNIDAGAGYGRPLSPVVVEGRKAWMLTETGRFLLPAP
ncbi:metallophosphoesterase family protein [Dinoroseobacter sp. S375]|uniref:metallophosphoesterase family protein n=1 Tax=Dinoroseobacter sp. S375 TaxID=3415136 RepID=UPI003C7CAE9C